LKIGKFVFCCAFEGLKKGVKVLFKGKIYKKDEFVCIGKSD